MTLLIFENELLILTPFLKNLFRFIPYEYDEYDRPTLPKKMVHIWMSGFPCDLSFLNRNMGG
jgi:hypothetical protein